MNAAIVIQVLKFLIEHQDEIADLIKTLEEVAVKVVGELKGPEKAGILKGWIAVQTNLIEDIDPIWFIVKPIFDKYVAKVKAS